MRSRDRILTKPKIFFHATAVLLFCIIQRVPIKKLCIFRKSITIHHSMTLPEVALVLLTTAIIRAIKIEAASTSETSVNFYQTT
jgi:hypothetical protein